jgi:AcrR family transcriptional regulator
VPPRSIPEDRLQDLLACATRVFLEQGYRRTQIADVAQALGIAKGTVYLYVQSKQALFYAVLTHADGEVPLASAVELPLGVPDLDELHALVRDTLAEEVIPPALEIALGRPQVDDPVAELERIVRQLYQLSFRRRTLIKLIDRCGRDHPELAKIFYGGGRFAQLDALVRYLDSRISAGALAAVVDVAVAARFVIECIATWAVHIHWDPSPQPIAAEVAEDVVVQLVVRSLVGGSR